MKHCLVVDDSSVIRKVARRILEGHEMKISEAENGQSALALCKQAMPDGILLDWNMPIMDGFEFLAELRSLPGGDAPKVVFCTTENDVAHITRAMRLSPFDPHVFNMQAAMASAHFFAGRYAEALSWAETASREQPNHLIAACIVAASGALGGRIAEATAAMARLRQLEPSLRCSTLADLLPLRRAEDFAKLAEGLRAAGLPE